MIKPQSSGGELRRMHSNGKLSLKSVLTRDEYYQTGFKLHVQRAAALIASLGISVALIKLLVFRNYAKGIPALTFNMLILLANVGVLVAQHISVAWLYIPYLVINPFCIVGILRFNVVPMAEIIVKIPALKTLANGKVNGMNNTIISGNDDELREQSGYIKFLELAQPVALMELVLYIVLCGLLFWFQLVVYRAYRFQALAKRRQRMEEGEKCGRLRKAATLERY